jgi:soluble cytochrome b562
MTLAPATRRQGLLATLLALALLAPLGLGGLSSASANSHEKGEKKEKLEDLMGVVNSGHKKLKRMLADPAKKADSLEALRLMIESAAKSKHHAPTMAKKVPADKMDAFLAGYQKGMNVLLRELMTLEEALLDGNAEAATASYEKLGAIKKQYHDQFIEE